MREKNVYVIWKGQFPNEQSQPQNNIEINFDNFFPGQK